MNRYLALAFVVLGAAGCSTVMLSSQNAEIKRRMAQAEYSAGRGHYQQAISEYERIANTSPKNPWQDQVLFDLGCLYALSENPDRDLSRSLGYFRRLKEEFPKSRYKAQIHVWLGLLETALSLESELEAGQARQHSLEQEIARLRAEQGDRESAWSAEADLHAKKLKELENLIQTQTAALEALQQQLKKMKEIDIQSEKKAKGIK